jgi:hypothetical protein
MVGVPILAGCDSFRSRWVERRASSSIFISNSRHGISIMFEEAVWPRHIEEIYLLEGRREN